MDIPNPFFSLKDGSLKSLNEVMHHLSNHFNLTNEHLKIRVPSGQMGLFRNRVGWTRSYLNKAGLIPVGGDTDGHVGVEAVVTDGPGQDGVAGHHQVVDTQRYQGAVVGRHTGRPQDLAVAHPS